MKDRYWEWSTKPYKADEDGWYSWDDVRPELGKREASFSIGLEWWQFKFVPIQIAFTCGWLSVSAALAWVEVELFIKWRDDTVEEEHEHT